MEQLGIEPKLLLAQIVNFTIILVVLTKFLYKPVLAMLEKRKKEIAQGLELTEKMRQEEEQLAIRKKKMLGEAQTEVEEMMKEMRKRIKEEEVELLREAQEKAEEIIKKAKKEAERQKEDVQVQIRNNAVVLGQEMAARLLATVMTGDLQHKIIAADIKKFEKTK